MKKLLILVDNIGEKKELFAGGLRERLTPGHELYLARFSDIAFYLESGKVEVFVTSLGQKVTEFDLIYFRRAGKGFAVLAGTLAVALDFLKVKYFDSTWREIGPVGSKLTSMLKLAAANLPIIPLLYYWDTEVEANINQIIEKIGFPMVAKELGIQLGKGVHLLKSREDFAKLPIKLEGRSQNSQYLFQKFLDKADEYRLLVLKDRVAVAEKKIATVTGEFRNNVALGAREEFLSRDEIAPAVQEMAIKGAQALGIEVAGVDVTVDKEGKAWLLEVNRGPGLTYDTKISPEIDELAKFFVRELDATDDHD